MESDTEKAHFQPSARAFLVAMHIYRGSEIKIYTLFCGVHLYACGTMHGFCSVLNIADFIFVGVVYYREKWDRVSFVNHLEF